MQLHASLLLAAGYALSFPFAPSEPAVNRHGPGFDLVPAINAAVALHSDVHPAGIAAHAVTLDHVARETLGVPPADLVRTTARLTVPAGEVWQTTLAHESLVLTLESGTLRLHMEDGGARIARAARVGLDSRALDEVTPGQDAFLRAGDRVVTHGDSALTVQSDDTPTVATIVRVGLPANP